VDFVGYMDELKGGDVPPSLDFMGMHGICGWTERWKVSPNLILVIKTYLVGMNDREVSLVFGFTDIQKYYACNEWLECKVREMNNCD